MVHSLTCVGVLPVQFIKLCEFAGIGHVGHGYIKKGTKIILVLKLLIYGCSMQCTTAVDTAI